MNKNIKEKNNSVEGNYIFRIIYLTLLDVASFIFIVCNWHDCINFSRLSGYNIIFCFFLVLLFLPFIKSISIGDNKLESGLQKDSKENSLKEINDEISLLKSHINIKEDKEESIKNEEK